MQLFEVFVLFTVSTSFIVLIWLRFFIYDICKMCIHTDVYIYIYVHEKLLSWNLFAFCYTDSLSRPDRNQSVIALVGTPTR